MGISEKIRVLGVSGSLRRASANTRLLHIMDKLRPDEVIMTIHDIGDLPLFNADLLADGQFPAAVQAWRAQVKAADVILFASPEYNYSVTGALKNAIDWASIPDLGAPRTAPRPLQDKPAGVVGVGGRLGTVRGQMHLRQIALFLNMHLMIKPEVYLSQFPTPLFDDHGEIADPATQDLLRQFMQNLALWTRRFQQELNVEAGV